MVIIYIFFFFSSRRRHTRCGRDWSSDVCSSDLELTDYIREREGYDYSHHGKAGNPSTEFVPDEIVDRFCLMGPAAAHISRLQELAELGVDQFSLYLMHDDREQTLASYGTQIIPKLT